jgi:hypothetical protein
VALDPHFTGPCSDPAVWRRRTPDPEHPLPGALVPDSFGALERLVPGTVRVARPVTASRGAVRIEGAPRSYDFELAGPCGVPRSVSVRTKNRRTGEVVGLEVQAKPAASPAPEGCSSSFEPGVGGRAIHPWCLVQKRPPSEVRIGPGEIDVDTTQVFAPETHVVIAPGTTIRLAKRANLLFRGRVTAEGSASQPIRFSGIDWGAIAIQGPQAAGSSLAHVDLSGGSGSVVDGRHYTGMFDVYDTADFTLSDARLHGATGGDILHLAYVERAKLTRVVVERSPSDGVDLEHSDVTLRSVTVLGAADDALDLMGSRVVAQDLNLLDCSDNGLSAGEQSDVHLTGSVVARCPMGLLVKNESRIQLQDVAVVAAKVGIRVERRSDYYTGESVARGAGLWFVAVDEPKQLMSHPRFEVEPCGEPSARDLTSLLQRRGLALGDDLIRWRGPGEHSP